MVFASRWPSFCWAEKIETRIQTNSTSVDIFYTAHSACSASAPVSHIATNTTSNLTTKCNFPSVVKKPSNLREFTLDELKEATKNFDISLKIGEGGFGIVYKGVIKSLEDPRLEIKVAVKKQRDVELKGQEHWLKEVNFLGKVEHPNLVKLVGYCAEDNENETHRLLVYEYMPNGSLEDRLLGKSNEHLSWPMRLKVAIDAARGLTYLHEGMADSIIFRDFKPSNILLDDQWNAKLSDFGCIRLGPSEDDTHVTTGVAGTFGYIAPEYTSTGHLRTDSDVWSFGVFLYVLITGKPPFNPNLPKNEQNLLEWVKPYLQDKKFKLIVDSRIEGDFPLKSAKELLKIANKCLVENHKLRPKISDVLNKIHRLIKDYSIETMGPLVPIVDTEGAIDGQKVSHEQQSSTVMKIKRKRRFICCPCIC